MSYEERQSPKHLYCRGIIGDFVRLSTGNSAADKPADFNTHKIPGAGAEIEATILSAFCPDYGVELLLYGSPPVVYIASNAFRSHRIDCDDSKNRSEARTKGM
jgi:hypothetical protein